jgi:hypothetical protein
MPCHWHVIHGKKINALHSFDIEINKLFLDMKMNDNIYLSCTTFDFTPKNNYIYVACYKNVWESKTNYPSMYKY